jgi:Domain of unknown function (DUF222)
VDPEPSQPLPGDPAPDGPDDEAVPSACIGLPSWVDEAGWAQRFGDLCIEQEPEDPVSAFYDDPDVGPPPDSEQESWEMLTARARQDGAEYQELIARLAAAGQSESAHVKGEGPVPGSPEGPAAGFGQGRPLDAAAPSTVMSGLADEASGEDRAFQDVTDDQLMGLVGARQRLVARQHWEELTAVAEFIRRRPHPEADPAMVSCGMPEAASDDAAADLAAQLHVTAGMAAGLIHLARDLVVKLPLTRAALRDGIIDLDKARTIAMSCLLLTQAEARRAERILFGLDVGEMTGWMVRDRIGRAVIEVNPEAARRRREAAQRNGRVEVFPELSGNTHISGRELPPELALAAIGNIDARARQLRAAGMAGDMDCLRTLAYLEMLGAPLPAAPTPTPSPAPAPGPAPGTVPGQDGTSSGQDGTSSGTGAGTSAEGPGNGGNDPGGPGNDPRGPGNDPGGPGNGPGGPQDGTPGGGTGPGRVPPGFAAKVNLTVALADLTLPLLTFLGLAERPGTISRIGPVDPDLARTLAAAAARNPDSTWCITITGADHRPVAHGCGRPPPRGRKRRRGQRGAARQGQPAEPARDGPAGQPGDNHDPPGTGTIRLNIAALTGNTTHAGGACELEFRLENLAGPCDHAQQAAGHDPGVKLKHLTGILNQHCTYLTCRRPHRQCDYEHSTPFEEGGRTCLCEGGPVCRHHHRDKQAPGWHLEHGENRGWFRWTTASGRKYTTKTTQYPD